MTKNTDKKYVRWYSRSSLLVISSNGHQIKTRRCIERTRARRPTNRYLHQVRRAATLCGELRRRRYRATYRAATVEEAAAAAATAASPLLGERNARADRRWRQYRIETRRARVVVSSLASCRAACVSRLGPVLSRLLASIERSCVSLSERANAVAFNCRAC